MSLLRVRLEDFQTKEDLAEGRRLIREKVKEGLKEAGQRAVLPEAKRRSPAIVAQALTTKATTRGAYLTTIGPRKFDNITGLLNFGGSPKGQIVPTKAKALHFRSGNVIVAAVGEPGKPRARYRGKGFLEAAINIATPQMEAIASEKVFEAFKGLVR
jgi:hypothetical protein